MFFTVSGKATTIQEAYDILVNVTILIYFVPYLYLFAVLVRLRRSGERAPGEMRIPGGAAGLWTIALLGFMATLIALALTFVPPPGTGALNYEVNIILQAAVVLGIGIAFYRWGRSS